MNTKTESGSQLTLEGFAPTIFQRRTVGVLASHARTSALPESRLDFRETVQACFSELCTLSDNLGKKISPLTFSLRTLKICLALMEDGISPGCSLKWTGGGYNAEWQVLNSKDFGVPQNRERVFIIGHLRSRRTAEVFPVTGSGGKNHIHQVGQLKAERENKNQYRVYDPNGIGPCLNGMTGGGRQPCTFFDMTIGGD